jgi:isocitrate/isopropylmalate dehydrogenase
MAKYRIAWLPGDGVGGEVMEAARLVLDALRIDAEYVHGDIGWEFWRTEGNALPERTVKILKETNCALFGAITSKPKEESEAELDASLRSRGFVYSSPIVGLRQLFDLHSNMRPCKAYPGNPLNYRDGIDIVVFRENTEGLYAGVEFYPTPREVLDFLGGKSKKFGRFAKLPENEIALGLRIITKKGCDRIVRSAFEFAKRYGRKKVTVVEKPNVLRETSGLMVREARAVAKEYPGIELDEANIDAMCMWLVKNPMSYDVLVASNLFGDIISDLAAQLVGGLGFASAANLGDSYAVFEPTHGSAPKYAGMYKVNPIATILAAKLMLDWLGDARSAERIEHAVAKVIKEGKARTYDMGGKSTTMEVAEEIARKL